MTGFLISPLLIVLSAYFLKFTWRLASKPDYFSFSPRYSHQALRVEKAFKVVLLFSVGAGLFLAGTGLFIDGFQLLASN